MTNQHYWLAGELAKKSGVSTDTLRHYERKGVLPRPHRSNNGYRLYPHSALNRVLIVRRALAVGFSLDELARILRERDKGGAPCREVHKLASEKLREVEERLTALAGLRDELKLIIADWNTRLSNAPADTQVGLLETLTINIAEKSQSPPANKNGVRRMPPTLNQKKEGKNEKS
ncbi:MAG: heavy metal-responsive transcriptional regulator [Pyrinomonadaceae bacterium]